MRIEIYEGSDEDTLRLRLIRSDYYGKGAITLESVDTNGDGEYDILYIDEDGVTMLEGAADGVGLPGDESDRVRVNLE